MGCVDLVASIEGCWVPDQIWGCFLAYFDGMGGFNGTGLADGVCVIWCD